MPNEPQTTAADANPLLALDPSIALGGFREPARLVRAEGWDWDHEVRVWLPPTYHVDPDRRFPTLWVTDNSLELMQSAVGGSAMGMGPELIIVAVGCPADTHPSEFQRRRSYDFIPPADLMGPMFAAAAGMVSGAEGFLDFLVNQLRPQLAAEYRMDPDDHGYAGHSGGAQFGLYTLFTKPDSFARYLISSPAAYEPFLAMEDRWNTDHDDLPAQVFLSAGEAEGSHPVWASAMILSTTALVAERLIGRGYPSLDLTLRIFGGEDHLSVMPVAYCTGVRHLWAAAAPPPSLLAAVEAAARR